MQRKGAFSSLPGLFFVSLLALSFSNAFGQAPPPVPSAVLTRMKLQDFVAGADGAKRLASLKSAVEKMKSLDGSPHDSADYRRSWAYWANIHGYYGPESPEGTVQGQRDYLKTIFTGQQLVDALAFYDGMEDQSLPPASDTSPAHDIALAVWDTCQHSNAGKDTTAENVGLNQANFFGWHRMYLYYFERVLRWAAQDPTLTLPYWDYTDPAQEELPAAFRELASPLYEARRDADINSDKKKLAAIKTNIDPLLPETNYLTYEFKIERGIHGYVHCTVAMTCPVAYMGDVPVAGNDPIFYTHHANIDRMWSCWQKLHPNTLPTQLWEMQQFMFPDETGALQKQPVLNFEDTTKLGYKYDNEDSCYRNPPAVVPAHVVMAVQSSTEPVSFPNLVSASGPLSLQRTATSVNIGLSVANRKAMAAMSSPSATAAQPSTELVLRELAADVPPGSQLDVYIEKAEQPGSRQYVGTVNWFGAFGHHGMKMPSVQSYDFDITSQLKALGLTSNSQALKVTLQASDGREDTGKTASLTAGEPAAFSSTANLRVKAIEIRQTK